MEEWEMNAAEVIREESKRTERYDTLLEVQEVAERTDDVQAIRQAIKRLLAEARQQKKAVEAEDFNGR